MPVDKDWFTVAVSLLSEYSNSKDIGIRSRTHVLGNICFVNFNTISLVTLKSTYGCTREMSFPKIVQRGMNNLSTESWIWQTLFTKKSEKTCGSWGVM